MEGFEFEKLELEGAYLIRNYNANDERGRFSKIFESEIYRSNGLKFMPDEIFVSISVKNVIRGLHFQLKAPQVKLVSVLQGKVLDVLVDLRPESKTFGKWICEVMSGDDHLAIFIPRGFAHGFAVMEDETIMLYQCEGMYDRTSDTGIRFDDPEIGVIWPIRKNMAIVSERDLGLMSFVEYKKRPMEV